MNRPAALRLGTRGSPLALWQAGRIAAALEACGATVRIVEVNTTGDRYGDVPLPELGPPGVFSRELDEALLAGRIDLAVHSLKDLPAALPDGIALAAVSERADPRDALVGRGPLTWRELPEGATVATCSRRRAAQLRLARPDLQVADLRGNIGTRLAKLDRTPAWTAILLAVAGLLRLGEARRIGERLPLDLMLPAPGQGALAVTARADDPAAIRLARRAANHRPTELATTAERALLEAAEGGCEVPVAAYADADPVEPGKVRLRARIAAPDGSRVVDGTARARVETVAEAAALGRRLARQLLARGGAEILGACVSR
ncbi:MAG TPA: hydroxymethylbilane synthase [Gemmatimonadales bacterium]|nr:hydroxymethylbilane synthase [Gemmatimonadales bacterium]